MIPRPDDYYRVLPEIVWCTFGVLAMVLQPSVRNRHVLNAIAFTGALMIAWSQAPASDASPLQSLAEERRTPDGFLRSPCQFFYALSGTFVGKWFPRFDESASLAAIFAASALFAAT